MWFVNTDLSEWEDDDEEDTLPGKSKIELKEKIDLPDGSTAMECCKCHRQLKWAEPNQPDDTFKCYGCKIGW